MSVFFLLILGCTSKFVCSLYRDDLKKKWLAEKGTNLDFGEGRLGMVAMGSYGKIVLENQA